MREDWDDATRSGLLPGYVGGNLASSLPTHCVEARLENRDAFSTLHDTLVVNLWLGWRGSGNLGRPLFKLNLLTGEEWYIEPKTKEN